MAAGIAVVGSLSAAVYTSRMDTQALSGLPEDTARVVENSLSGAATVSEDIPASVFLQAQEAFVAGLNTTGWTGAGAVLVLAVVTAVMLRGIGVLESEPAAEGTGADRTEPEGADAAERSATSPS
ncbi:hypothetical protein GCM10027590_35440 [Nocardiopsis nanhaiensis]